MTIPSERCKKILKSIDEQKIEKAIKDAEAIRSQIFQELQAYRTYYFFSEVHPAMKSSGLGLRMLQADSLLIDPSYVEAIVVDGNKALFPGESPVSRERTAALGELIALTIQRCDAMSKYDVQAWILTDVATRYSAKVVGERVVLKGDPYYYIWGDNNTGEPIEMGGCTSALKELKHSFALNAPLTWRAVLHVSRISALLRAIKAIKPKLTKNLLKQSQNMEPLMTIQFSTPRAWPRQGYED